MHYKDIRQETYQGLKDKRYSKPSWAVAQTVRETGLLEDICKHGVGHPNEDWLMDHHENHWAIHGCDGCCCKGD